MSSECEIFWRRRMFWEPNKMADFWKSVSIFRVWNYLGKWQPFVWIFRDWTAGERQNLFNETANKSFCSSMALPWCRILRIYGRWIHSKWKEFSFRSKKRKSSIETMNLAFPEQKIHTYPSKINQTKMQSRTHLITGQLIYVPFIFLR